MPYLDFVTFFKEIFKLDEESFNNFIYDGRERSILHIAAVNNHYAIASNILIAIQDVNKLDNEGSTPLLLSLYYKSDEVTKLLLSNKGINANIHNLKYVFHLI